MEGYHDGEGTEHLFYDNSLREVTAQPGQGELKRIPPMAINPCREERCGSIAATNELPSTSVAKYATKKERQNYCKKSLSR